MTAIKQIYRFMKHLAIRAVFRALILPILCFIRFFKDFKVSMIRVDRIGHLALNNDIHLRRRQLRLIGPDTAVYCFYSRPICNRQLFDMFDRVMNIKRSSFITWLIQVNRDLLERVYLYETLDLGANEYLEFDGTKKTLTFTKEEDDKGKAELRKMGIAEDDWFVCMHARDSAYMEQVASRDKLDPKVYSYHDYRDSDINNFEKACEFIASMGGYILRMGAETSTPIRFENEKLIHYASKHRSEFMDVYLPAKCMFYLGNTSGHTYVATIFDRPVVCTNSAPLPHTPYCRRDLLIPKKYRYIDSKKPIHVKELHSLGLIGHFFQGQLFTEKGVEFVENSQEELLGVTKEMYSQIKSGEIIETKEQIYFREKYQRTVKNHSVHTHTAGRIAKSFFELNREFLEME